MGKQQFRYNGSLEQAQKLLETRNLTRQDVIHFLQNEGRLERKDDYDLQLEAYQQKRIEIEGLLRKIPTGAARIDEDGRLVEVENNGEPPAPPRIDLPPPPRVDAAIQAAAQQLQAQNVEDQQNNPPGTLLRIAAVVFTVTVAFLFIIMQTFLSTYPQIPPNVKTDRVLRHALNLRMITAHLKSCPGLHRQPTLTWWQKVQNKLPWTEPKVDCSDGVLHIPALSVFVDELLKAKSLERVLLLEPFVVNHGMNHSWALTCPEVPLHQRVPTHEGSSRKNRLCFRGVYDEILNDKDIKQVIEYGQKLIREGGDHLDIRRDVDSLSAIRVTVKKLQDLFWMRYSLLVTPVAYRVYAVPTSNAMDGMLDPALTSLINTTTYSNHLAKVQRTNEFSRYSPPWPFNIKPYRDTCKLMADQEADPGFEYHTTAFISDGAGEDFWGGATLYVDNHPYNLNRYKKLASGMTVDATRGRVLISSGGTENRRCHFPVRSGIRAALQVWWKDISQETESTKSDACEADSKPSSYFKWPS